MAALSAGSLLRLVLTLGICCLPSCDWFSRWVYAVSPPAIGSHAGYILCLLQRAVSTQSLASLAPAKSLDQESGKEAAEKVQHDLTPERAAHVRSTSYTPPCIEGSPAVEEEARAGSGGRDRAGSAGTRPYFPDENTLR
eukprot:1184937-Prorocentrum_minimum.AAC.7